jgi:cobalamin biosynthetic protein CobC
MLEHGGRLRRAAATYERPLSEWLDLSTGINAHSWPAPPIPPEQWARLPETEDDLESAARDYYQTDTLLPVCGSQAAIQALPRLRRSCRVGLVHPSYAEHHHAWHQAGHQIQLLDETEIDNQLPRLDVLILVRPNNPTGSLLPASQLLDWHQQLAQREGWLILDEAFADPTPEISLLSHLRPGLIILRSLGKFFGLAGARVGFVCSESRLLSRLESLLGPWSVSGPARWVATGALRDKPWQKEARQVLSLQSKRLNSLLTHHNLTPKGGCALFQWVVTPRAKTLYQGLARQGILVRLFDSPTSLRFGLPRCETDWQRLESALGRLTRTPHMAI